MPRNTRTFTDIDMSFSALPVSGDVSVKYDEYAIKQAVKNLILTNNYERPFHPEIGSQIQSLLFSLYNPMTQTLLEQTIRNTIINYEPRVKLQDVRVIGTPDENSVDISIFFTILNTIQPIKLDITLRRTR